MMTSPTVEQYARMAWHARQRLMERINAYNRDDSVRETARAILADMPPEDDLEVYRRRHTLANDYTLDVKGRSA